MINKVGPDNGNKQSPGVPPSTMGHSKTPSTCPPDTTQSQFGKAQTSGKNQHDRMGAGSQVENFKTFPKTAR
ncbi:MAG TPA: hypothetical protein VMV77_12480 [Bacteroidales bacterium]|nr:hypothetical protein [Bacteroidales bacterium]